MKLLTGIVIFASALSGLCSEMSRPMKARVIQPLYLKGEQAAYDCLHWELEELAKCDASLDVIVLPEASDVQAQIPDTETYGRVIARNHDKLMDACAETARRCDAVVFVNAKETISGGWYNTTFAFNRSGRLVGKYKKQHLTPGERRRYGWNATTYTREWSEPFILEIDGIRYAFLTCYDFYFYEAYAPIARQRPDVIIGCSHQRSDKHEALAFMGSFIAYNTAAYLIRASVSMGTESHLGGASMVVAPDGEILGDMKSEVGHLDVTFDPFKKYLKPAGYGNPHATHPDYVEKGRCPWKYRPAGSAVVPGLVDAPPKRLCTHRGFSAVAPENSLAAFGAAVGLGVSEIEFDLWPTKDGEIVSIHDPTLDRVSDGSGLVYTKTLAELQKLDFGIKRNRHFEGLRIVRIEDILRKFSCHVLMNIHLKTVGLDSWDEKVLKKLIGALDAYDARKHVYFMTSNPVLHAQLATLAPDIVRCMGHASRDKYKIVDDALANGCKMIQLCKPHFDRETIERAHAAGLRCNVFWADDPTEAKQFLEMGADTILTNDYQPIAAATGLK